MYEARFSNPDVASNRPNLYNCKKLKRFFFSGGYSSGLDYDEKQELSYEQICNGFLGPPPSPKYKVLV